jgi:hypothetical protein
MSDVRPVLRAGALAVADRYTHVIPCKVLEIMPAAAWYAIDKEWTNAPGSQEVRVRLTATRGPYKRGEVLTLCARECYPREAFRQRKYGARVSYYTVERSEVQS